MLINLRNELRSQAVADDRREPKTPERPAPRPSRLRAGCRKAAAVVEFAVVAPVFFLLIFGMIEYGRMVMVQQILTNAAREGARVGILDNSSATDVDAAVNQYLTPANIHGATITPNPANPSSAALGAPVSVTVSVPFAKVSWLPSPLYLGGKTLTFTATMRRETLH